MLSAFIDYNLYGFVVDSNKIIMGNWCWSAERCPKNRSQSNQEHSSSHWKMRKWQRQQRFPRKCLGCKKTIDIVTLLTDTSNDCINFVSNFYSLSTTWPVTSWKNNTTVNAISLERSRHWTNWWPPKVHWENSCSTRNSWIKNSISSTRSKPFVFFTYQIFEQNILFLLCTLRTNTRLWS